RSRGARAGMPPCRRTRSPSTAARSSCYYGHDPAVLQAQIRRVVLHEIAHHFGISDERLHELDRY
ncbi:MAG TPA: metallopeptidase family protein, partial [Gaiellaceae bacterium]